MSGRSTRHSTTRQWTGLITLLLVSGSASSQGTPTLKEAAPSLHTKAITTDNPSGSVASLRNVDVSSTTLKYVGQVPAPNVEGSIDDKLPDTFTIKSNGKKEESLSDSKSENLRIQEPLTKVVGLEEKRSTNGSVLEFSEDEENKKIDDLEDDDEREPTTASPKKVVDMGNTAPGNSKSKENEHGVEKPQENVPEIGISLANDTNVNYNSKKPGKSSKNEEALGNDSNNLKSVLENTTNIIASGANIAYDQEKGKGPKGQVEVVKNSTLPKILRIMETGAHGERKEVEILESAGQETVIETSRSTVIPELKDVANADDKTSNLTLNGGDDDVGKFNDTKILQTPRGRTISFGSSNEFVTNDNKIRGPIRDNDGITDSPINQIGAGITKESIQEHKSTLKPYPYAKTNFRSNSSGILLTGDSEILESTEEASALENTIGQRQQKKKFVVTEPSVVIDNSIQQFKPTYYKRSGNSSRITTNTDVTIPTTASSLEVEGKNVMTLTTKSITSQNETTVFVSSLSVSNTENDVPRGKDETDKSRIDAKETSSLDLIGNGITEIIAGIKNDSIRVVEDSVTIASKLATTGGISMSRATENALVQNTTEKIATTNIDVQTDPEESMLNMSQFNVTEGSTRISINQSVTNVTTLTPTLSLMTLIPESLPQKSMPETSTVSTSTVSKIRLISTPESFSTSTAIPNSSLVTTLMAETSTMSISEVSSMSSSTPMTSSVPSLIPTISSVLTKASSVANLSTEAQTTVTPEISTDGLPPKAFKTASSFSPDETVVSTTSKIEYVFVGLTESTVSQQHISTSESSNAVKLDSELASSTPSSVAESPTSSSTNVFTTTSLGANDSEATVSTESSIEISTDPVILIAENDTDINPTTMSTLEFTTSEVSTISKEDTAELITTVENAATTLTSEFVETSTEELSTVTNSMNVTGIILDVNKNSTESGRAVDSSTSVPGAILTGNSSETIIGTTEAVNLSNTTEIPKFPEVPKIPITNLTSESPNEISTSERSNTNVTSKSFSSNSTVIELTTKTSTTAPKPDLSTTSEGNIDIITEDSILIGRGGGVPSLVKVVFDGSWADVCPHLDVLRQSLADLLTSGLEKTVLASQIIFQNNPCSGGYSASMMTTELSVTTLLLYVVDENGQFDGEMTKTLPSLYSKSPIKLQVNIRSFQLVQDSDSGNAIAVVVVSCVALICLVLLAGLLFIMRKRQTRFNYGERCRPVSLDAYSLDSVSAYNSVRRKGAARASKRSYGNPTFEDSSAIPSHPLNFAGLSTFCNEQNAISEEFTGIPQVTARIDELPQGAEVKNRYANVVPLPETRVSLMKINNDPLSEYINASYVRGPKNATKYYIACQAPIESTVTDFWRMIWEQQSKVVIMLTDLVENGVEKCAEYIPPSEVTDCHRLFGDFQVTLKKRETKEKYAISTLHLKNLENNTFREISHIWYLWPANGVQSDAAGLIAVLLEARALQRGGPGPIVVHCSPGTGRTGTLIALDLGIRQYEITRTVDVPRVVYTIRRDRAGAVQTKEQYAFIYKALNLYATKLAGGALES